MTEALAAFVALAVLAGVGAWIGRHGPTMTAEDEREYSYVSGSMSRAAFQAIREKNLKEKEQFGDGSHAPYWGKRSWNGSFTLHRGVWVDDFSPVPSNRELDTFRKAYWREHEVLKFTLVEGEQMAPYGTDGAWIKVRATMGTPSELRGADGALVEYIPSVNVSPVEAGTGWWGYAFMGRLPASMSVLVKKRGSDPDKWLVGAAPTTKDGQ